MSKEEKIMQAQISECIQAVIRGGQKVKAGIWQADDRFKEFNMLVLRNMITQFDIHDVDLVIATGADMPWAEDHFQERTSGVPSNPGESYKEWPYANFTEDNDPYKDGKLFSHTYMERFWPKKAGSGRIINENNMGIRYELGDLNDVIIQLQSNPLTRQAYLPIFFPEDTGATHGQRVPCTLGYYFWIEGDKLYCNYLIRSCDMFRHFRNDVYLTGRLLQYIANTLKLRYGKIHFFGFNMHVFENDVYALKKKESQIWKDLPLTE